MTATHPFELLRAAEAKHGDRVALVYRESRITYSQLLGRVEQARDAMLTAGIEPGMRVGLAIGGVAYIEGFFAALAAGAVVAPIDPRLPASWIGTILDDLAPVVVFQNANDHRTHTGHDVVDVADDAEIPLHAQIAHDTPPRTLRPQSASPDPNALAAIFQTAGTSARPLGVMHSHAGLVRANDAVEQSMRRALAPTLQPDRLVRTFSVWRHLGRRLIGAARDPVVLLPMALQNISGHTSIIGALASGGRLIITDAFHPHRTLETIERERVTNFGGTPVMLELLLRVRQPFDCDSLLLVMSGGEVVAPRVLEDVATRYGCGVGTSYGATELGGPVLMTRLDDPPRDQYETAGRPLPGVDIRTAAGEHGASELLVRVPNPMLGYWNDAPRTAAALDNDGWYRTGDLADIESGGTVRILGRVDDVVRRNDTVVHVAEVERALEGLVGAREVAVVQIDDAPGTQKLCAFVVATSSTDIDPELVTTSAGTVLPAGWTLDRVEMMPRLPRTTDGKVRKEELRARAGHHPVAGAVVEEDTWPHR